jgi:hypothetical protein
VFVEEVFGCGAAALPVMPASVPYPATVNVAVFGLSPSR